MYGGIFLVVLGSVDPGRIVVGDPAPRAILGVLFYLKSGHEERFLQNRLFGLRGLLENRAEAAPPRDHLASPRRTGTRSDWSLAT